MLQGPAQTHVAALLSFTFTLLWSVLQELLLGTAV